MNECVNGGEHDFQPFLVAEKEPTPEAISASDLAGYSNPDSQATVIGSLKAKTYTVVCRKCGMAPWIPSGTEPSPAWDISELDKGTEDA